jgi:hypothetical protein
MANVDRVMGSSASKGTARIMLTVTGHRAGGRAFSVRHGDVIAAVSGDQALDFQVAMMVYNTVSALTSQAFEDVTLDTVQITGSISSKAATWTRPKVEIKQHGTWVSASQPVVARVGSKLWTRTTLTQYRAPSVHSVVKVGLVVPRAAANHTTALVVTGGASSDDIGNLLVQSSSSGVEIDQLLGESDGGPASLDELLTELRTAPRSDQITAELRNMVSDTVYARHTGRASTAVDQVAAVVPALVS